MKRVIEASEYLKYFDFMERILEKDYQISGNKIYKTYFRKNTKIEFAKFYQIRYNYPVYWISVYHSNKIDVEIVAIRFTIRLYRDLQNQHKLGILSSYLELFNIKIDNK